MNTPKLVAFLALTSMSVAIACFLVFQNEKPLPQDPQPPSSVVVFDGGLSIAMLKLHGFSNVTLFVQRGGLTGRIVVTGESNGVLTAPVDYPK